MTSLHNPIWCLRGIAKRAINVSAFNSDSLHTGFVFKSMRSGG